MRKWLYEILENVDYQLYVIWFRENMQKSGIVWELFTNVMKVDEEIRII